MSDIFTGKGRHLIYGIHSVEEYLKLAPEMIHTCLIQANSKTGKRMLELAEKKGVKVRVLSKSSFKELEAGRKFQGVAAEVRPFPLSDALELIEKVKGDRKGILVALDSVEDVGNLGSILRTSGFFGVKGVILTKDRCVSITPAVIKISCGAFAHVPIGIVTNLVRTITLAKDNGFVAVGTLAHGGIPLGKLEVEGPLFVVVGSEAKGLRRLTREACDHLVTINPYANIESLNVGVALGVILYAIREKMNKFDYE